MLEQRNGFTQSLSEGTNDLIEVTYKNIVDMGRRLTEKPLKH